MHWRTTFTTVVCLAAILAAGTRAHAADGFDAPGKDKVTAAAVFLTYATTFTVQMWDARTTIDAVDAGARETNPLLSPFSTNSGAIIAASLARATAIDLAVKSIARKNRVAAVLIGAGVNSAYVVIAAHNRSVAQAQRAR
jgi:hypothetical protein